MTDKDEVEWRGRKFGELTPDEQRRAARKACRQLEQELEGAVLFDTNEMEDER